MKIANKIKSIEIYNAKTLNKFEVVKSKWDNIPSELSDYNTEGI
jgi:hypothetical protein